MPIMVTYPDEEVARLARELGRREGLHEVEAVRWALRNALTAHDELRALRSEVSDLRRQKAEIQRERVLATRHDGLPPSPYAQGREDVDAGVSRRDDEEAMLTRVRAIVAAAAKTRREPDMSDDEALGYPEMFPDLYRKP